ncbi:MAG: hypothetical protein HY690_02945 [Chloroflexi bacterium]|nr:hypothetical protein [Chloroflexota bacterium]
MKSTQTTTPTPPRTVGELLARYHALLGRRSRRPGNGLGGRRADRDAHGTRARRGSGPARQADAAR